MILLFHNFLNFAKLLNKKYGTHTESRILHLHKIFYSANKKLNELISEKGMIISISNNPIWDFISVIPK